MRHNQLLTEKIKESLAAVLPITAIVLVVVEGDLISPCSGYRMEALDEFDFAPVLQWCLNQTEPSEQARSVVLADEA